MLAKTLSLLCLNLFALLLNGCGITIPNIRECSVAGVLAAGGNCAYTLSDKTETMTLDQFIDFLEGKDGKGPAICSSTEDFNKEATALAEACRILGPRCSKEVVDAIERAQSRIVMLQKRSSQ